MKYLIPLIFFAATFSLYGERPNIILILADDLGYADVGFNGSPDIVTPKMDSLAEKGVIFSSAYVVHPFCGPSRMALLSGRYPHDFGAPYNLPPYSSGDYREKGMPEDEVLFSKVLQDAGYFTGLMGKWHLGHQPECHPNVRGFDEFYGFLGGGILYFGPYQAQNSAGKVWDYKVHPEHNGVSDTSLTADDYMTDVLTEKGVEFINTASEKEEPFFLFMSYNAPHTMLAAKDEDMAMFPDLTDQRRTYAGMMYALDRGIGQLVDTLKANDAYENTLIVFLSDNGGRTDKGANNSPLRGSKGDALEGGSRVPMFFHWPKALEGGERYEHPVSALDFYPSFLSIAEAALPAGKKLDGATIWDSLSVGESARKGEMLFWMRHRNGFSDVAGRRDDWKVVRTGMQPWKLYNVAKDPAESKDLSAQYPEMMQQMILQAEKWARTHTEPQWYDNKKGEERWKNTNMPNTDELFRL
ncbi:MAG: sulfatase-like hydrolase/transferase [Opitutaceae bacterium]